MKNLKNIGTGLAVALAALVLAGCAQRTLAPTVDEAQLAGAVVRAEVAPSVYELVYSARQHAVFVAAPDVTEDAAARGASRLLRLHPDTLAVQADIELPHRGFGLALDDAKGRVYVGHGFDGAVSVVDIESNRVVATLALVPKIEDSTARRPYAHSLRQLLVDPARQRLYLPALANGGQPDSLLYVVDTESLTLEKTVPGLGFESTGAALDAAHNRLFVSNLQAQLITIDTQALVPVHTAEIEVDQPINIVYDGQGERIFAVDQGIGFRSAWRNKGLGRDMPPRSKGHQVVVLEPVSGRSLARIRTDQNPLNVLLDAERKRLYVTNFNGIRVAEGKGTLTVFDSESYALLHVVALPPHPNSMAFDGENNVLYVSVKNDGNRTKAGKPESVVRIDLNSLP
ncbi:YncE family protein [Corticibacter populi]|nr:YncE family protein [Corticibacter populi]RZS33558.1 hypothetical protein EV687_1882 [Corticibacter populi]